MQSIAHIRARGRTADDDWGGVSSWYGGRPRLSDGEAWPALTDGTPLHFLAQIDLAEIPGGVRPKGVPAAGHLVFFATTDFENSGLAAPHATFGEYAWPCAVLYEPEAPAALRPEPDDLPPVYGSSWRYYRPAGAIPEPPTTFGRLAVTFEGLEASSATLAERLYESWNREPVYAPRPPEFRVSPEAGDVLWRAVSVILLDARASLRSKEAFLEGFGAKMKNAKARKAALAKGRPKAEALIARWEARCAEHAPLEALGPSMGAAFFDDLDALQALLEEMGTSPNYLGKYNRRPGDGTQMDVPYYWYHGLATQAVYRELLTGSDADYAALPASVTEGLWRDPGAAKFPPRSGDMVFGVDADGSINPISEELRRDCVLLLELNTSFLWTWGDAGKVQFWIGKDDLARGAWDAAFLMLRSS